MAANRGAQRAAAASRPTAHRLEARQFSPPWQSQPSLVSAIRTKAVRFAPLHNPRVASRLLGFLVMMSWLYSSNGTTS